MRKKGYLSITLFLFMCSFAFFGCASFSKKTKELDEDYTRVTYNYEVGSTHVAVLSVAPWEEAVSALQPKYEFTPAMALNNSIPTTMRYEEILVDSIRANLNLSAPSLPKAESSADKETSKDTGKKDKTETSSKDNTASAKEQGDDKKSENASIDKIKSEPSGRDPLIKYVAATSLFQEVQLVNRYLHDAATRKNFRAYVVRLQVSVMPHARNMPYDTYLNISFLTTTHGKIKGQPVSMDFTEDEFKSIGDQDPRNDQYYPYNALRDIISANNTNDEQLCKKMGNDKLNETPSNEINALNQLLRCENLYALVENKKGIYSDRVQTLKANYDLQGKNRLTKFNREALELAFPMECPKRAELNSASAFSESDFTSHFSSKQLLMALNNIEITSSGGDDDITKINSILANNDLYDKITQSLQKDPNRNEDLHQLKDLRQVFEVNAGYELTKFNRGILEEFYPGKYTKKVRWQEPIIVPLLVTDDIEAMASSRSLQNIIQLGFVLGITGKLGEKIDLQNISDNLQKISGNNLNSLFSVARVSDNTLRVRLGAMQQPNSRYATVPRTHNISVLLLVPEEHAKDLSKKIYIDSWTNFVDSITGKALKNTDENMETDREIIKLLRDFEFEANRESTKLVKQMVWDFNTNHYDDFLMHYDSLKTYKAPDNDGLDDINATDFYLAIGDIAVGSVTTYASFPLPVRTQCMPEQTVLLIDNGKETEAILSGGCDNPIMAVEKASLNIINLKDTNKTASFRIKDFLFDNKWCEQLTLVFPSLASTLTECFDKDKKLDGNACKIGLKLRLKDGTTNVKENCQKPDAPFDTIYVFKKEDKIKFKPTDLKAIRATASQVNLSWTDNSSDETGFKIERKDEKCGTYAEISSVGPNVTTFADTGLKNDKTYYYRIRAYNSTGISDYSNESDAKPPTASSTESKKEEKKEADCSNETGIKNPETSKAKPQKNKKNTKNK